MVNNNFLNTKAGLNNILNLLVVDIALVAAQILSVKRTKSQIVKRRNDDATDQDVDLHLMSIGADRLGVLMKRTT